MEVVCDPCAAFKAAAAAPAEAAAATPPVDLGGAPIRPTAPCAGTKGRLCRAAPTRSSGARWAHSRDAALHMPHAAPAVRLAEKWVNQHGVAIVVSNGSVVDFRGDAIVNAANEGASPPSPPPRSLAQAWSVV